MTPAQRKAAAMKARRRKLKAALAKLPTPERYRNAYDPVLAEAFKPQPSWWERLMRFIGERGKGRDRA